MTQSDNFLPLEPQAQEQVSNPDPDHPQATSPKDQRAGRPHFIGIKHPQVEAVHTFQDRDTSKKLETTSPDGSEDKFSNGGKKVPIIKHMSLKFILMANQDSPPDENGDLKAAPVVTVLF
ncbi:hypothetical protein DSO57_1005991 [Entomophthora muscae]|uniref:Uncharacterized protein n=1 Tax=Entomophthora muscae TaxID=34485 RepID=A0ACC2SKE9_9FUNG|nr:hypothetical protein DSO57_1005991 [Entomophthora muscae]